MKFIHVYPSLESYWRSIILFGQNVASYKFALAKALLALGPRQQERISLQELAEPFSQQIAEHLDRSDKQCSSRSSKFLDECRAFNRGEISSGELANRAVRLGFNNVIDAFHVVNRANLPVRFFEDDRKADTPSIVITDDLYNLLGSHDFKSFMAEVEARWRLVETSWELGLNRSTLEIHHDTESGLFYSPRLRRQQITGCRDALNGYQKGRCFYCFSKISVGDGEPDIAHVDHYFPHALKQFKPDVNLDGVWNLVLACQSCNSGIGGKFARVPELRLLERLSTRNDFLIDSHHPLRDTLMLQTGATPGKRHRFLQKVDSWAICLLIHRWEPEVEHAPAF